jgi:mannitol-1-/sugar-/sorbitol-6-phosphatase
MNFPAWADVRKAWLFDLDGTLIDSGACIAAAWSAWCQKHGLNAENVIHEAYGRRAADSMRFILPESDVDAEVAFLEDMECELVEGLVVAPGAHLLLEQISVNPWAIVTSGSNRVATHRIEHTRLRIPPVLISADDVSNGKPDPEGYLLAASRLNVNPTDCIVVEDAVAGIRAGKSAGMKVIAVASTHSVKELVEADYVCESLIRLTDVVRRPDDRTIPLLA